MQYPSRLTVDVYKAVLSYIVSFVPINVDMN